MGQLSNVGRTLRDALFTLAGIALVGHEAVIAAEPRLDILAIAAALLGLPGYLFTERLFNKTPPPDPAAQSAAAAAGQRGGDPP
jgi:hypothetical protein